MVEVYIDDLVVKTKENAGYASDLVEVFNILSNISYALT